MKKLIYIVTLLAILNTSSAYAAGSCTVTSGPSAGLTQYFQDLQSVLSAVQSVINSSSCGSNGTGTQKAYNSIVGDYNKAINTNGFISSWEFNLYPIFGGGQVPEEFYRDHDYIVSKTDKINKMLVQAGKKCALDKPITSQTIKDNATKYGVKSSSISEVLRGFLTLNTDTSVYFRCVVVGSMGGCDLSNTTLKNEISNSYGAEARDACNQNSSYDKMMEQIGKITDGSYGFSAISKGIYEWKAAIKLLGQALGGDKDQAYYDKEKALLAKELQRQGIRGTQADAIINNLKLANECNTSISSCISDSMGRMVQSFKETWKVISGQVVPNSNSTKDIAKNFSSLKTQNDIFNDIANDYSNIKDSMAGGNKTQEKGLATLIQLHQNLVATNENIVGHIKVAQELCDMQGKGEGNCK